MSEKTEKSEKHTQSGTKESISASKAEQIINDAFGHQAKEAKTSVEERWEPLCSGTEPPKNAKKENPAIDEMHIKTIADLPGLKTKSTVDSHFPLCDEAPYGDLNKAKRPDSHTKKSDESVKKETKTTEHGPRIMDGEGY